VRLSEAIRLGSMLRPQIFGQMSNALGSCPFGAAKEAIGDRAPECFWDPERTFPVVGLLPMECPVCGEVEKLRASIISEHLNDRHRWSRERIAAWIETVEREIEAKEQPADSLVDLALQGK